MSHKAQRRGTSLNVMLLAGTSKSHDSPGPQCNHEDGSPWQPCSFGKLPVDYTIPLQELFAKASMAFIEDSDNLEIFQLAAVQSHISTPDGLPSWALNLGSFSDTAPTARPIRPQLYTNCFRQTTYNQRPGFELNVDWTAISVAGYLFDRVETTISFEGVLPDGRAAPFWSKLDEVRLAMKEKFFQQSKCRLQAGNNISRDTAAVKSRDLDSGDNSSTETESVETRSIKRTFASNLIRRLRRSLRVVEQHFAREQAAQYSAARVGGKYYNSPGVLAEAVAYTLVAAIYIRHESSAARYATVIKGELGDFETSIRGSAWTVSKNLRDIFRDT